VSHQPIQRLIRSIDRLDAGLVTSALGTGAVVCLGFIQLLRTPLQQLSSSTIEVLAVRALLFLAPMLVSLLLLLREGPLLLATASERDAAPAPSRPSLLDAWGPELLASGLQCLVLSLYFMAAVVFAATLSLNQGNAIGELGFLIGQLEPARFAAFLVKATVYGAIAAAICLHQAPGSGPAHPAMAARMARSILLVSSVLVCLDLLWVIAIDPLQVGGG
jgi:hypothetical protein